mgnify:CR=1 FL=1
MTQYTDKVEQQRLKNAAEEWGQRIAYVHLNNGIEETKYNNGRIVKKNLETGHIDHFQADGRESLVRKFERAMADLVK